jgi:D-alanine-D-alanine ligase
MKIEIITTPNKELKETGFGTLDACNSVLYAVKKMGYTVKLTVCTSLKDLEDVVQRKPDLVILAVKYIVIENEKDIWLSEYFDKNNINFLGSSRETLKFDSDKVLAKSYLKERGINTANYFTAIPGEYKGDSDLPLQYPLFLKPLDAANGNGIDDLSLVNNFSEFESKVSFLYEMFELPVLVEEYLDGPEFTVAVIKTIAGDLLVSALEIVPPVSKNGLRILGEKAKKEDTEELKKTEDTFLMDRVKNLAINVFIDLGVRDFGRIDIKMNKHGHCFFMEANLVPGMTQGSSYFPKAFEIAHGLDYDQVIGLMVEEGIFRVPINASLIEPLFMDPEVSKNLV